MSSGRSVVRRGRQGIGSDDLQVVVEVEAETPHVCRGRGQREVVADHRDEERVAVQFEQHPRTAGAHRRGARHGCEQRHLAEEAAATRGTDQLAALHDVELAVGHDEERVAVVALLDDVGGGRDGRG